MPFYPVLAVERNTPRLEAIISSPAFFTFYGDPRSEDIADRLVLVSGMHCFAILAPKSDMQIRVAP